jgi:hypothetical protein
MSHSSIFFPLSKNDRKSKVKESEERLISVFCPRKEKSCHFEDGWCASEIHMYKNFRIHKRTVWCMLWIITRFLNAERRRRKIYMRQWVWSSSRMWERTKRNFYICAYLKSLINDKWPSSFSLRRTYFLFRERFFGRFLCERQFLFWEFGVWRGEDLGYFLFLVLKWVLLSYFF